MQTIKIEVVGKYARSPAEEIVCGNSDYFIEFNFSEEWKEHDLKTARFFFAESTVDRVFEGNVVQVPIIKDATVLEVGVYAGNLRTTTPALISCKKSILCRDGAPEEPEEDVYNQLMKIINEGIVAEAVPTMNIIDKNRIEVYEKHGGYYFSENNWKAFIGDEESGEFGYNRAYIERSNGRGTYGMYALSFNAEPIYNAWYSKAEWAERFAKEHPNETFREPYDSEYPLLDSIVQRANNGQITVPTRPLEGWHATSKSYTDDLISKLMSEITSIKEDVYSGTDGLAYEISKEYKDQYECIGLGDAPRNTDIEIAGYHNGLPVTMIGEGAFNNVPIKSVRIPSTIKWFKYNAFGWSGAVGAVYVKDLAKWAAATFESSSTPVTANPTPPKVYIKGRYTTDLVIPEGVIYISKRAFMHWKQFKTLTLPNTVKVLDEMAFQYCQGLESVTIPASVERVEGSAFGLCYALKSVTFEGKPKMISSATFQNDTAIFDIYVPWKEGEVAGAPWGATNATVHYECYGTEGLAYSLSSDGTYAICNGLGTATDTNIVIASYYNGVPVTEIKARAFSLKRTIKSVRIPNTVTTIGEAAFNSCNYLRKVYIGNGIKSIETRAFDIGAYEFDIYCDWVKGTKPEVEANAPWSGKYATIHYKSEV